MVVYREETGQVVAYMSFVKTPKITLYQIIKDAWLPNKAKERFHPNKLVFYLMCSLSLLQIIHTRGFVCGYISAETLFVNIV